MPNALKRFKKANAEPVDKEKMIKSLKESFLEELLEMIHLKWKLYGQTAMHNCYSMMVLSSLNLNGFSIRFQCGCKGERMTF